MRILGINAYHGDAAACLLKDGQLIAAVEEERFQRIKHWAGLPLEAIKYCLEEEGIGLEQVDFIAIGRDPRANLRRKIGFALRYPPSPAQLIERTHNVANISSLAKDLAKAFDLPPASLVGKIRRVEHHKAHLASAFLVSPFESAALLSVDGMGDFTSTMWGLGRDNSIRIDGAVYYPHSLGFFYTAITQYLGFWNYGDEYKIMGLAAFGEPEFLPQMRRMVKPMSDCGFRLNLKYFTHHNSGARMSWNGGAPTVGRMFSKYLEKEFGKARSSEEPLSRKHKNIAASAQALYEEHLFRMLKHLSQNTAETRLALAGGVAQNSLANGKIYENSNFKEIYIPPAGHDAGTAVGAAFYVWHETLKNPRLKAGKPMFIMESPFWGPQYNQSEIEKALRDSGLAYEKLEDRKLFERTAKLIAEGNIVGWFQGRSEWGPRALGNRSILANPAFPEIKDVLNHKIKRRESFRPFAPAIIEESVGEYFENSSPVPFMEKVYKIRPEKRSKIPAVVHVDGTGRLQTVSKKINPRYHKLIQEVGRLTGVPMVLNTSFNENEPIVNSPKEAIDCFLRTKMDVLVLENFLILRENQAPESSA